MPGKKSQKTGERKKRSFGLTKMSNDVKTKPSVRANKRLKAKKYFHAR